MPKRRPNWVPIARPAQLKALASPLRQELIDVLESGGPASVAELAERLGRPADSLYFHLRVLQKVGLLAQEERRQKGRHAFAVWDLVARPLRIDRGLARNTDLAAVVAGILRLAARDYRRGLGASGTVAEGPARNHWGGRARGWLSTRDLARVNELLEELGALMRGSAPGDGRQAVALAWVLAPTPARRQR